MASRLLTILQVYYSSSFLQLRSIPSHYKGLRRIDSLVQSDPTDLRAAHRPVDRRPVDRRATNRKATNRRAANRRATDRRAANHRAVDRGPKVLSAVDVRAVDCSPVRAIDYISKALGAVDINALGSKAKGAKFYRHPRRTSTLSSSLIQKY